MNKILALLLVLSLLLSGCVAGTVADPVNANLTATQDDAQVTIQGKTSDTTYQAPRIDSNTHTLKTITYPHSEEHDGNAFFLNSNDDIMADGENFTITVETPDTAEWMHLTFTTEGILATHTYVYEGVTVSVNGSVVIPFNRDRNSTNTCGGIFRINDTTADLGTLLWQWHSGSKRESGISMEGQEIILKQNTKYLFVIESEANNNAASGQLNWYVHTNLEP